MKKLLTTTMATMVSLGAFAQGTVHFGTFGGGVNAPATNWVTGQRLTGTDYMAQLFYNDPRGAADDAIDPRTGQPLLTPVAGIATFSTGTSEAPRGYITSATGGGTRVLDGVAGGTLADVQIRVWSS